jgi:outer membrane receptor for ferrienterochelin and colicins
MDWQLTDKLNLSFGGEFAYWKEHNATNSDVKKEEAPRLFAAVDYAVSPAHKVSFKTYTQRMDADFEDTYYGTQTAEVSYEDAEIQYTGLWADHHLVTLGGEFLRENLESNTVSKITNDTKSIYAQDEWELMNSGLVVVPGIRFDSNDAWGDEFNPKLSIMYRLGEDTTFRGSFGRSFKAPLASQTFADPFNHHTMWVFSNPNLKPETSLTYQLGVEQYLLGRRVMFSATVYHMDVDDLIVQESTGQMHLGLPVKSYANIESAEIRGLESLIKIMFTDRWDMSLGYTYTCALNKSTDEPLKDTPENAVNGSLNYHHTEIDLGFSIFGSYTDEQPNIVYVPGFSSETTDAFTTFGLTAWKSFSDRARIKFSAGNIFNAELEGSDTIHVTRNISLSAEFKF